MKSIIKLLLIIFLGLGCWACAEDEVNEPMPISIVNFVIESQTLPEAGDPLKVNLLFDRAAAANGSFSIRLSGDAVYQQHYTTTPAANQGVITLNIEKGQATAYVTVNPVNDEDSLGNQTMIFTLENLSAGFKLGSKATTAVELLEDDAKPGNGGGEATIEFGENLVNLSESDDKGYDISMLLQGSVKYTEPIFVEILSTDGFEYGTDYITEPLTMQNQMKLEVYPGIEDLKFSVIPINDRLLSGNFELKLSILDNLTQLVKGKQDTLVVKIEEDDIIDPAALHTIADLRSKFENYEGNWYLPNDYYIEGIVTSDKNAIDDKTIYIQDATGGIMLSFHTSSMMKHGDKVQINLKNASGKIINGQKAIVGVADLAGITLGTNFMVEPELITIEQLASGNYQGKRVRIQNVSFKDADGIKTWFGTYRISDGMYAGGITTFATADFSQQILPAGKMTITGIVGDWNNIQPQNYHLDVVR